MSDRSIELKRIVKDLEDVLQVDEHDNKIKKMETDQREWLEKVFDLISEDKLDLAKKLYYSIILDENGAAVDYWLSSESAIMDYMIKTIDVDRQNGIRSFLLDFNSFDEVISVYYRLKFLIRRFEFDLSEELKEELNDFMNQYQISEYALIQMIQFDGFYKIKLLNEIAVFCMKHEKYDYVIPILLEAISIGEKDAILEEAYAYISSFNLGYFLAMVGELTLALQYLNSIPLENLMKTNKPLEDAVASLIKDIEEGNAILEYDRLYKMRWEKEVILPHITEPNTICKIAFVICVNKEWYFEECCNYIHNLRIPKGYEIEIIPVRDARSILSGYEQARKSIDAKYIIYLHQDGMCVNPYMLYEALNIFEKDKNVGILGVAGTRQIPTTGIWWEQELSQGHYNIYQDSVMAIGIDNYENSSKTYVRDSHDYMQALDGVFLMTCGDVKWRDDLFEGWHIYDVSQCMEYIRAGYKCAIAKPIHRLWIWHNERYQTVLGTDYHKSRLLFVKEYLQELI